MASEFAVEEVDPIVYAIINNIPGDYHSANLRNYFSQFIESKGFECFHFRHRPETQVASTGEGQGETNKREETKTTCCVVKLKNGNLRSLMRMYHRRHWLDKKGDSIPSFCRISRIRVSPLRPKEDEESEYQTRSELKNIPSEREEFTEADLLKLAELHPPDVMPNGNVGTPTVVFLDFIKQCRLPPSVIKKLGLIFPKTMTNRKYGCVPFDYGGEIEDVQANDEIVVVHSGTGQEIQVVDVTKEKHHEESSTVAESLKTDTLHSMSGSSSIDYKAERRKKKKDKKLTRRLMDEKIEEKMIAKPAESDDDNDSCEEWERHEAMYDDPSNQERNKERLFEEDIELKWEKGGSGLVFYTDAQYWQEQEGDFDEQTTDDLDVDMSGYYEEGAGDKDARDYISLRQANRRRLGIEETDQFSSGIGKFERHTKGIGRKILEHQGWSDGQGLGTTVIGISEALGNEGQNPRDKKGLGYRGEKLTRYGIPIKRKHGNQEMSITTKYDNPTETDPTEPLLRRNEPYGLKHRLISFNKS